jgi:hypothetical protein
VYFSNFMVGRAISADLSAEGEANFAGAFWGGVFSDVSWLKTDPAAPAMDRQKINKRLRSTEFIQILLNDSPTPYQTQLAVIGLHRIAKHHQDTFETWERQSPYWRCANRQSGDWRSRHGISVVPGSGKAYDSRD